ncbi:MAG: ABC transporter substrate-binding protein [Sulfobacillus acidophilus]|uniref:ABC transporter substrate-binding protein n=1 Tax=Sulfobacillus acidophilus TaxID=53633 RepID=A0A2T2WL39_9FIRM|nr:MAG: ABC transporter substrate-binding protein [Sulfobacillus acidophilus]
MVLRRHHLALGAALCLTAPLLAAWSSNARNQSTTSAASVVVALPVQTSPNWFFPVLSASAYTDTNTQMYDLMYMPLVYFNNKDEADYSQSLASSIVSNATGSVYTIHLNPKWHWSNGAPVTAQDVVFTWDIMKAASGNGNLPWVYGGAGTGGMPNDLKSVVATSKYTVTITLNITANPNWFIHNDIGQFVIVPKASWNRYPSNMQKELTWIKSIANDPTAQPYHVVDGPYKFSSYTPNEEWIFTPNPSFDGHKSSIGRLIFQYQTSTSSEFAALRSGTVQVGYLPPAMWSVRKDLTGDKYWPSYLFGFNMMRLDENPGAEDGMGSVFSQAYVRQAMEMGIDQPAIISGIYHGQGIIEDSPVPSEPKTVFDDPALNKQLYPFNIKAGQKLLESHGWRLVHGVMTKGKQKFEFPLIYSSGDPAVQDTVELLQRDWAKEGIKISLVSMPFDNLVTTDHGKPSGWDAAYWGAGWTYEPDFYPTGGALFKTGAASNAGGYSNPTMNKLIEDTYLPATAAQSQKALFAYEAYAAKQVPYLWFPWLATLNESSTALKGVESTFNPIEDLYMPNYWTVKK